VVEYRRHSENVSNDVGLMLREVLHVLEDQRPFVQGEERLEQALESGRRNWIAHFGPMLPGNMLRHALRGNVKTASRALLTGIRYYPRGFHEFALARLLRRPSPQQR